MVCNAFRTVDAFIEFRSKEKLVALYICDISWVRMKTIFGFMKIKTNLG